MEPFSKKVESHPQQKQRKRSFEYTQEPCQQPHCVWIPKTLVMPLGNGYAWVPKQLLHRSVSETPSEAIKTQKLPQIAKPHPKFVWQSQQPKQPIKFIKPSKIDLSKAWRTNSTIFSSTPPPKKK